MGINPFRQLKPGQKIWARENRAAGSWHIVGVLEGGNAPRERAYQSLRFYAGENAPALAWERQCRQWPTSKLPHEAAASWSASAKSILASLERPVFRELWNPSYARVVARIAKETTKASPLTKEDLAQIAAWEAK